jgi:hypothetical protein
VPRPRSRWEEDNVAPTNFGALAVAVGFVVLIAGIILLVELL